MPQLVVDATGNDLTYRIIGAAMRVHNQIGPGFKEEVYEKALAIEFEKDGVTAERQFPVNIDYEGVSVGLFYLDFFVEGKVVVELKALSYQLTNDERAQVINYLKATGASVGLLFNFGRKVLEYRRIFPSKDIQPLQRTGRYLINNSSRSK